MWTLVRTVDTALPPKPYVPRQRAVYQSPSERMQSVTLVGSAIPDSSRVFTAANNLIHVPGSPKRDDGKQPFRLWSGNSNCSVQDYDANSIENKENLEDCYSSEYETLTGNKINMYPSLYRITQNEFRRLSDQVKDLPPNGKFRGQGFKRCYTGSNGETKPVIYRTNLAASAKAFQSNKERPVYENKWKDDPPTRCRPVCPHGPERLHTTSPAPQILQQPTHSRSLSSPRPPTSTRKLPFGLVRHRSRSTSPAESTARRASASSSVTSIESGTTNDKTATKDSERVRKPDLKIDILNSGRTPDPFDTLTPSAAYLLSGIKPFSVYGDKQWVGSDDDTLSSTSGVTSCKDSDQDSAEEGDEPDLDKIDMKNLPKLELRPEKIDNMYMPEYTRGDRRKYDFDASNTLQHEYLFSHPLSEEMYNLATCTISKEDTDWREVVEHVPEDAIECAIIDRLIELERLQAKTGEWEAARKERLIKHARVRDAKRKISSTVRHQGARLRERKCCADCMQLLCIGNCTEQGPSKSNLCKICHEPHSTASCTENVYSGRVRSERVSLDDEKPKPTAPARPKSCHSCQRPNNSRTINANNILLGRPKSSNATYSRGQNSSRRDPKQFTATQIPEDVERDLIRLGIDPQTMKVDPKSVPSEVSVKERPRTACETTTRGRAGLCPSKSYFSQLRSSLTDLSKATKRAKSAGSRRKSGRTKRPQTALA